jgi:hypothetical protein
MPKAKKKADDDEADGRRLVEVQFQRLVPQTVTLVVAVPARWSDARVRRNLPKIYDEIVQSDHHWYDQDDFDPQPGAHELDGAAAPEDKPDLYYPPEDSDGDDK